MFIGPRSRAARSRLSQGSACQGERFRATFQEKTFRAISPPAHIFTSLWSQCANMHLVAVSGKMELAISSSDFLDLNLVVKVCPGGSN